MTTRFSGLRSPRAFVMSAPSSGRSSGTWASAQPRTGRPSDRNTMDAANFTTSAARSPASQPTLGRQRRGEEPMLGRFYQTAVALAGLTTLVASCTRDIPVQPRRPSLTAQLVAPSNDNFGNATVIAALPFSDSVDITDATVEPGEQPPSCAFGSSSGKTVWYTFTPAATGL